MIPAPDEDRIVFTLLQRDEGAGRVEKRKEVR